MREIKFRAWLKEEQKIGKVQILTDKGCFVLGAKPGENVLYDDGKTVVVAPQEGRFIPFEELELMQYTGLKDENGKEIYELDIVKVDNENDVITVCKYHNGCFILEDKAFGHWTRQLHNQPERLEIIGNIYENPELLES